MTLPSTSSDKISEEKPEQDEIDFAINILMASMIAHVHHPEVRLNFQATLPSIPEEGESEEEDAVFGTKDAAGETSTTASLPPPRPLTPDIVAVAPHDNQAPSFVSIPMPPIERNELEVPVPAGAIQTLKDPVRDIEEEELIPYVPMDDQKSNFSADIEDPQDGGNSGSESSEAEEDILVPITWGQCLKATVEGIALDTLTKTLPGLGFSLADFALTAAMAPYATPLKIVDALMTGGRSASAGYQGAQAILNRLEPDSIFKRYPTSTSLAAAAAYGGYGFATSFANPKVQIFKQIKTQWDATVPLFSDGLVDKLSADGVDLKTLTTEGAASFLLGWGKGELKEVLGGALKTWLGTPEIAALTDAVTTAATEVLGLESDTLIEASSTATSNIAKKFEHNLASTTAKWVSDTIIDAVGTALSNAAKVKSHNSRFGQYKFKKRKKDNLSKESIKKRFSRGAFYNNALKSVTASGFGGPAGSIGGIGNAGYLERSIGAAAATVGDVFKAHTSGAGDTSYDPLQYGANTLSRKRHGRSHRLKRLGSDGQVIAPSQHMGLFRRVADYADKRGNVHDVIARSYTTPTRKKQQPEFRGYPV